MSYLGKRRRVTAFSRRPMKRRNTSKYRRNAYNRASTVMAMRRTLNQRTGGQLGAELKYKDGNNSLVIPTNSWTQVTDVMNGIATGSSSTQRDGRQIIIKGVYSHIEIFSEIVEENYVRLALVLDTQYNGQTSNVNQDTNSEIFLNAIGDSGNPVTDFRNLDNTTRYKVLTDKVLKLRPSVGAGVASGDTLETAGNRPKHVYRLAKRLNMKVNYQDTTADASSIVDNALFWIMCRQNPSNPGFDRPIAVTVKHRVRFVG